jgi:hypothetical protein
VLYVIKTNWSNKKNNTFTKIVNTYQPNYLIKFENNFEEILKFVNNIFSLKENIQDLNIYKLTKEQKFNLINMSEFIDFKIKEKIKLCLNL